MVTWHRRIIRRLPAGKFTLEEIAARIARTRTRISDSGKIVKQQCTRLVATPWTARPSNADHTQSSVGERAHRAYLILSQFQTAYGFDASIMIESFGFRPNFCNRSDVT
jgi:hypothetical protein